jgi:hypothetical protein
MKATEIYKNYPVPLLLRKHHIRVASVGAYIADNFRQAKKINKDLVVKTLLLHDLGNIIKFNLDKASYMSKDEWKNIEKWRELQTTYRKKYKDEHVATYEMAKELGITQVLEYLAQMGTSKLPVLIKSRDFNLKLMTYADLRCSPFSVVTIDERFDDIIKRYKGTKHPLSDVKSMELRRKEALLLEKQLQEEVEISLPNVVEKDIHKYERYVKEIDI